jgi:hypothetical protein
VPGLDGAHLGNADLEIGEQFEKESLEGLIGAVDFVDQQHGRGVLSKNGFKQRALEQKLVAEDVSLLLFDRLPGSLLNFDGQ